MVALIAADDNIGCEKLKAKLIYWNYLVTSSILTICFSTKL